jgi:hypothetical protein
MDPTREEQIMKRAAVILGVAGAMLVAPSVAAAANVTAQTNPQRATAQVTSVQVAKPLRAYAARHRVMIHSVQVAHAQTISLNRAHSR